MLLKERHFFKRSNGRIEHAFSAECARQAQSRGVIRSVRWTPAGFVHRGAMLPCGQGHRHAGTSYQAALVFLPCGASSIVLIACIAGWPRVGCIDQTRRTGISLAVSKRPWTSRAFSTTSSARKNSKYPDCVVGRASAERRLLPPKYAWSLRLARSNRAASVGMLVPDSSDARTHARGKHHRHQGLPRF